MRMATTSSENSGEEDREGVEEAWAPTGRNGEYKYGNSVPETSLT